MHGFKLVHDDLRLGCLHLNSSLRGLDVDDGSLLVVLEDLDLFDGPFSDNFNNPFVTAGSIDHDDFTLGSDLSGSDNDVTVAVIHNNSSA